MTDVGLHKRSVAGGRTAAGSNRQQRHSLMLAYFCNAFIFLRKFYSGQQSASAGMTYLWDSNGDGGIILVFSADNPEQGACDTGQAFSRDQAGSGGDHKTLRQIRLITFE